MGFFTRKQPAEEKALQSIGDESWWTRIFDWNPGAWQAHDIYEASDTSVLAHPTVFTCTTLIQGDVGKLPFQIERYRQRVWQEASHPVIDLLQRPNKHQNQIQFKKQWIGSKLIHGNTYVLKVRSARGDVIGLIVLDPSKVTTLLSDSGEVFYQLTQDKIPAIEQTLTLPASEIIHDRDNCIYNPLIGLSPLFAAAESARIGNTIIKDSKGFFANGAKPSGMLTAPGSISDETANRLKAYFNENFSGDKAGRVAVAGDGLTYAQMRMSGVDSQLIEQLGWSDQKICSVYHVPPYMAGVGPMPTYNNIEALTVQYFTQCLQDLVCGMEECLNMGLDIPDGYRIRLGLDELFRMDQATLNKTLNESVGGGWMAPDEARRKVGLPPVPGGKYPYLQQQNYSLEALAKRDANDPFAAPEPPAIPAPKPDDDEMELRLAGVGAKFREKLLA